MATKTAKKKAVKKPASKKATTRTAKKNAAVKSDSPAPSTGGAAVQKMLHSDAFPERVEGIERLIVEFLEAEKSAEAAIAKAEDHRVTAQKALKEAVRAEGLDSYSSYDMRYVVELKKLDDRLKVRPVKKKEATPCHVGTAAGEPEEPILDGDD
jgi:hypothetical protein